jgi:hypothetical protein
LEAVTRQNMQQGLQEMLEEEVGRDTTGGHTKETPMATVTVLNFNTLEGADVEGDVGAKGATSADVTGPLAGQVGLGADVKALFLEGYPSYRVGNNDARYAW